MSVTRVEVDLSNIESQKFKASVLYALRSYSFYDAETDERKIRKSEASGRKLAQVIKDANKDNVLSSVKRLKEIGLLREENGFYIIEDVESGVSYKDVDTEFLKEMIGKRSSDYIKVYLWLYRRWEWKKSLRQEALFSIGDILHGVFHIDYVNSRVYDKVKDILADMVSDGLLVYNVIKLENTYLRAIVIMRTKFVISDLVKKQDGIYFGKEDYVRTEHMKLGEEEPKVIADSIGLSDRPRSGGFYLTNSE